MQSGLEHTIGSSWNIPSASCWELPAPAGRPATFGPPPPQLAPEFFSMDVDSGGSELPGAAMSPPTATWNHPPVPEPMPAQPPPAADNPWAAHQSAEATGANGPPLPWVSPVSSAVHTFDSAVPVSTAELHRADSTAPKVAFPLLSNIRRLHEVRTM